MIKRVAGFQTFILTVLVALLSLVILLSTVDLAIGIGVEVWQGRGVLPVDGLIRVLGLFLLVLLAIELLESMTLFLHDHSFRAELILVVTMIAVARKLIIVDVGQLDSLGLLAMGAIILSLSAGYYLVHKSSRERSPSIRETTQAGEDGTR